MQNLELKPKYQNQANRLVKNLFTKCTTLLIQIIFIRFIGTHAEYNKIDAEII